MLGISGSDVEEWGVKQKARFFSISWKRPPHPLPSPLPTCQPQSSPLPMKLTQPLPSLSPQPRISVPSPHPLLGKLLLVLYGSAQVSPPPRSLPEPLGLGWMPLQLWPLPLFCPGQLLEARTLPLLVTLPQHPTSYQAPCGNSLQRGG